MVVVVNNAIFKSKFSGILTAIGHGIGISIYALCAVIGIGLILQTNIFVFNLLKLLSIFFFSMNVFFQFSKSVLAAAGVKHIFENRC